MSNRPHRRPRRARGGPSRTTWEQLAEVANALEGCICRPDVRGWHDEHGGRHLTYAHDLWCPLAHLDTVTRITVVDLGGAA